MKWNSCVMIYWKELLIWDIRQIDLRHLSKDVYIIKKPGPQYKTASGFSLILG